MFFALCPLLTVYCFLLAAICSPLALSYKLSAIGALKHLVDHPMQLPSHILY